MYINKDKIPVYIFSAIYLAFCIAFIVYSIKYSRYHRKLKDSRESYSCGYEEGKEAIVFSGFNEQIERLEVVANSLTKQIAEKGLKTVKKPVKDLDKSK